MKKIPFLILTLFLLQNALPSIDNSFCQEVFNCMKAYKRIIATSRSIEKFVEGKTSPEEQKKSLEKFAKFTTDYSIECPFGPLFGMQFATQSQQKEIIQICGPAFVEVVNAFVEEMKNSSIPLKL